MGAKLTIDILKEGASKLLKNRGFQRYICCCCFAGEGRMVMGLHHTDDCAWADAMIELHNARGL